MSPDEEDFFQGSEAEAPAPPARRWSAAQMVKCENCARPNPPTRPACLYCGATLPIREETAALRQPLLRPLEKGEPGYNVIRVGGEIGPAALSETAQLLQLETAQLEKILAAPPPLPLARAPSADEAHLIERRLLARGLRVEVLADDVLAAEALPPARIRALEFTTKSIVGWTLGETTELRFSWDEVILCVAARLFVRQLEVEERRARGPENELLETRELETDEAVFDLYSTRADGGWRVAAHGFDFSCLGREKTLVAAENMVRLKRALLVEARGARLDENYRQVRHLLAPIWPLAQHTEARGWRRMVGRGFRVEAATVSSNAAQFTSYSRLQHYFELKRRAAETTIPQLER